MNPCLLALDAGTSGLKAIVLDAVTGRTVAAASSSYPTVYTADGGATQDPADWWAAAVHACAVLSQHHPDAMKAVASVACSGMMNGVVLTDKHGSALAPAILHADTRAGRQCDQLTASVGAAELFRATSNRPDPRLSLPKIMRLHELHPDLVKRASFVVQTKDYLASCLTGRAGVTDPSDASLTGAFSVVNRVWRTDIWDAAGLPRHLLPEVVPSATVIGRVGVRGRELGLADGVPVVCGGGDGACATAGAGVANGDAYLYLGGTAWVGLRTDAPPTDARLSAYCCLDESVTVFGTAQTAGTSTDWLSSIVGQSLTGLDAQAAHIAPGSEKLFFLPYLQGERAPLWDASARGVFFGLSTHHTAAHLLRSVREGVAFALCSILDVFAENGQSVDSLRVLGGGGASDLWTTVLPAVFGRPLVPVQGGASATARGAALCAGVGVGLFGSWDDALSTVQTDTPLLPSADLANAYVPLRAFWGTLYPALQERFAALSRV